jgi:hypothetical protein
MGSRGAGFGSVLAGEALELAPLGRAGRGGGFAASAMTASTSDTMEERPAKPFFLPLLVSLSLSLPAT